MKYLTCTLGCLGWLLLAATPATATVPVSCAPGLPPVQSQGIQIVNGVIELLDNACYSPPVPCTGIPPALAFSNMAATPSSAEPGDIVTYTANVANFITTPVAGVTYDTCTLELRQPNSTLASSTAIPSLASSISRPVTIPASATNGTWTIRPVCRRFVSSQEIVVAAIPAVSVQVTSSEPPPPPGCQAMTPPFRAGTISEFSAPIGSTGGFGVVFGAQIGDWVYNTTTNAFNSGQLEWVNVRAFRFTAPASPLSGELRIPSSPSGVAFSISTQCGKFDVSTACQGIASNSIFWSTSGTGNGCHLTPGQTYYLNAAGINLPQYNSNGSVQPTSNCSCPGANCVNNTASCQFRNLMTITQ